MPLDSSPQSQSHAQVLFIRCGLQAQQGGHMPLNPLPYAHSRIVLLTTVKIQVHTVRCIRGITCARTSRTPTSMHLQAISSRTSCKPSCRQTQIVFRSLLALYGQQKSNALPLFAE